MFDYLMTKRGELATNYSAIRAHIKTTGIKTIYVPDTMVLVRNPCAFEILTGNEISTDNPKTRQMAELVSSLAIQYSRDPNGIAVVSTVIDELDKIKSSETHDEFTQYSARIALRNLDWIASKSQGRPQDGIILPNKAVLFTEDESIGQAKKYADKPNNDTHIVCTVREIQRALHGLAEVVFISDDSTARFRARQLGVRVEEFRYENVKNATNLYPGYQRLAFAGSKFTQFEGEEPISISKCPDLERITKSFKPNQALIIENRSILIQSHANPNSLDASCEKNDSSEQASPYKLWFVSPDNTLVLPAKHYSPDLLNLDAIPAPTVDRSLPRRKRKTTSKTGVITAPVNPELKFSTPIKHAVMDLLLNPDVEFASVMGGVGTGKTLCALMAGLIQIKRGDFERMYYLRPLVPMGKDIGYVPGGKADKMREWGKPADQNLRFIFDSPQSNRETIDAQIKRLYDTHTIEIEPPSQIVGQTIFDCIFIADESHQFTREEIKMLIGRIGRGSKLYLLGDPEQTGAVYRPHVTLDNNGLVHVVSKLPGKRKYGHISLPPEDVMRSEVASYQRDV